MSAPNDMPANKYRFWKALIVATAVFLIFNGFAFSDYRLFRPLRTDFNWAVGCNFGGHCNYSGGGLSPIDRFGRAVEVPESPPPTVHWFNWKFVLLNPGLWFGIIFSLMCAPDLISRGLPPAILGAVGLLGFLTAKYFHSRWGVEYSGIFLISAPYSVLGVLAGYAFNRAPQNE